MIEGGCTHPRDPMFGECPFHLGNSMLHCSQCVLEGLAKGKEMSEEKPPQVCDYLDCRVKVRPGEKLCDEHKAEEYEFVDHPKHYNEHPSGIECIDVIEHMTLNVGSAVKYLWRAGLKPGEADLRDLDKAIWYINREKERLTKAKK